MSYDYTPIKKLNPMSRKAWQAMSLFDQANFFKQGGTLFDEPDVPKVLELITSKTGQSVTREQWDAMDVKAQAAFIKSGLVSVE